MKKFQLFSFYTVQDNSVSNLDPEWWARESLAVLHEEMVLGNKVYRDFDEQIAEAGDVVNANIPGTFGIKRKGTNDDVEIQAATSTKVPVCLNQHLYASFLIRDKEASLAQQDLMNMFLPEALQTIASGIDRAINGVIPLFFENYVGRLGGLDSSNVVSQIVATRKQAQMLKWKGERNFVVTPDTEATMLETPQFVSAEKVGDDGTALREASLGRKFGFNFWAPQNTPYVEATQNTLGAINNTGGYSAGTTTLVVDGFAGALTVGSYVTIAGSNYPYRVSASASATNLVLDTGLKDDVADNAIVTVVTPAAIDNAAGYVSGHVKTIHIDGLSAAPAIGQILAIGADVYTVIEVENYSSGECDVLLSDPLRSTCVDDAVVALGPSGSYNFAFLKEAIALINRPLATPQARGVDCAVVDYKGIAIRVLFDYLSQKQGVLCTVDTLIGVKAMRNTHGIVMFG